MLWLYIVLSIFVLIGMSAFFGAPYVPSHRRDVRKLFDEAAPIGTGDVLLDLGSGDGLVLREASRRGAKAVGYEIHPLFVGISKLLSWRDPNITIHLTNIWTAPFPKKVTMVYVFSVLRDAKRLTKKMQQEANRLGRPLTLICYASPLAGQVPVQTFGAYSVYVFEPLHLG